MLALLLAGAGDRVLRGGGCGVLEACGGSGSTSALGSPAGLSQWDESGPELQGFFLTSTFHIRKSCGGGSGALSAPGESCSG